MSNNCLCNLFDNNSCTWLIILVLIILFSNNGNGCGYSNGCGSSYSNGCGCGC